jgi:hypothetical protein
MYNINASEASVYFRKTKCPETGNNTLDLLCRKREAFLIDPRSDVEFWTDEAYELYREAARTLFERYTVLNDSQVVDVFDLAIHNIIRKNVDLSTNIARPLVMDNQ